MSLHWPLSTSTASFCCFFTFCNTSVMLVSRGRPRLSTPGFYSVTFLLLCFACRQTFILTTEKLKKSVRSLKPWGTRMSESWRFGVFDFSSAFRSRSSQSMGFCFFFNYYCVFFFLKMFFVSRVVQCKTTRCSQLHKCVWSEGHSSSAWWVQSGFQKRVKSSTVTINLQLLERNNIRRRQPSHIIASVCRISSALNIAWFFFKCSIYSDWICHKTNYT